MKYCVCVFSVQLSFSSVELLHCCVRLKHLYIKVDRYSEISLCDIIYKLKQITTELTLLRLCTQRFVDRCAISNFTCIHTTNVMQSYLSGIQTSFGRKCP